MSKIEIEFGGSQSSADIINQRRVINGPDDGLMQVAPLKHPWAKELWDQALQNTWVPQEVPMGPDVEHWNAKDVLTERERQMYIRSLAFVSNLDGMQTNNLTLFIMKQLTSPELRLLITRQAFEEALHTHSYATMIEAIGLNPDEVYGLYRKDKVLYEKNQYVLNSLNKISDDNFKTGTLENDQLFLEACIGNVILEGIYFYSAFLNFYVLKRNNKMPGSAEMIQFINRDEDLHLQIFIQTVQTIKGEQPELWTAEFQERMIKNIIGAVEHEISWGTSCIGDGVLGLTPDTLTEYIQFVGNIRLKNVGLPPQWEASNPFPWIDEFTQGNMTETNFFEGTVREYQTGSLDWD